MKNFYPFTFLSMLLCSAGATLVFLQPQHNLYGIITALLGYAILMKGEAKYLPTLQFIASFFCSVMFGLSLDGFNGGIPYFTLLFLLFEIHGNTRLIFLNKMTMVKYIWFEPMVMIIATALYVYANLVSEIGWIGWVFPGLFLMLNEFFCVAGVMESLKNIKLMLKGFSVEAGKTAPTFSLPDAEGKTISLEDYKSKKNILLIFIKGDWCPSCHIMLRTYQSNIDKFTSKNVMLIGIGPDPIQVNKSFVQKMGIEYIMLSDTEQAVSKLYGIQIPEKHKGAGYEAGVPLPASFLIDRGGTVRYTSRPDRLGEFIDPATIFPILEQLR